MSLIPIKESSGVSSLIDSSDNINGRPKGARERVVIEKNIDLLADSGNQNQQLETIKAL